VKPTARSDGNARERRQVLHGMDEQLGALGELVPADAQHVLEDITCGFVDSLLGDSASGVVDADTLAEPVVPLQPALHLLRRREDAGRAGQVMRVDGADRPLGHGVHIGVDEAGLDVYVRQVVVEAKVVGEERELPRVGRGEGGRLGRDQEVGIARVDTQERLEHGEIAEGLPCLFPDLGGYVESERVSGEVVYSHSPPVDLVTPGRELPRNAIHHDLESADDAVVRLHHRDSHRG
jgi:hypothetical protein